MPIFRLPRMALGTVELGMPYGIGRDNSAPPPKQLARAILNEAVDRGLWMLDTAASYGQSEQIIGECLSNRRDEFLLATKVPPTEDASEIRSGVEQSLRNLRTDHVDILYLHSATPSQVVDEPTIEALQKEVVRGTTRAIGAAVYGEEASLAAAAAGYDFIQVAHSALDRRVEGSVIESCIRCGIGLVSRSALLKGALTPRVHSLPPSMEPLKKAVLSLAAKLEVSVEKLPQIALRYCLSQEGIDSTLVGVTDLTELRGVIEAEEEGPLDAHQAEVIRSLRPLDIEFIDPSLWPPEIR